MQRKLKCILVDDDPSVYDIFKEYLKDNEYAEITDYFQDPQEFLKSNKKVDLVFLDIVMPIVDGFTVALAIKPTPVIMFTGNSEHYKDIMNMIDAIDAFPKPIIKERLLKSVADASVLLNSKKPQQGYAFFHTSEGQVNVLLSDILFVKAIKNSHGHLLMYLKGENKLILKGYTIEYIHKTVGFLLQSNRSELISPDAIGLFEHNKVHLKGVIENNKPVYSILGRDHRENFLSQIPPI